MTEIEQLRFDLCIFFKWLYINDAVQNAVNKKNAAVKVQNFQMAVVHRDEEKKLINEAAAISLILNSVAERYLPKSEPTPEVSDTTADAK